MAPFDSLRYHQTSDSDSEFTPDQRELRIAKAAIKEVFSLLGVDVNDIEQVEEFRKDLRFGGTMRRRADKGVMLLIGAIVTLLVGVVGTGLWETLKHHLGNGQ